jgi:cell fate regulator YaaT (PSP1 superfamily)
VNRYLVRYGTVPEVARFRSAEPLSRGAAVVVQTQRGLQLGTVLERERATAAAVDDDEPQVERLAEATDLATAQRLQRDCETEFAVWCERIAEWELSLELVDLEWTLDRSKLILYVLTERGPDSTKLALQAAAAGIGPIEVQPIAREGLVVAESGGGCGSGGGGCGCSH